MKKLMIVAAILCLVGSAQSALASRMMAVGPPENHGQDICGVFNGAEKEMADFGMMHRMRHAHHARINTSTPDILPDVKNHETRLEDCLLKFALDRPSHKGGKAQCCSMAPGKCCLKNPHCQTVPLPTTMLLLCSGLFSLYGLKKKIH